MTDKPPLPDDLLREIELLAPQLMAIDHYAVLGLTEQASDEAIKAAYLRTTKRYHPDRWAAREAGVHRKRMEAIFARATEAYEVLRSPEARLDYDRSLSAVRGIPRASSVPLAHPTPIAPPARRAVPAPAPQPRAQPAPSRTPSSPSLSAVDPGAPPPSSPQAAAARLIEALRRANPGAASAARPSPRVVQAPIAAPVVAPAPAADGKPRPRIVVAEDDETLRRMVLRVLGELGECEGAADGALALGMVQRLVDAGHAPALVVTDVMMPNMDGLELARRLKNNPKTSRIPIVMLTAKTGPRDMIDGVNAGARYYVNKPFKVDELKARVKKALGVP